MIIRLAFLALALAAALTAPANAATQLAGKVTVSGDRTAYALVEWPGGDADGEFRRVGEFGALVLVPHEGAKPSWDNSFALTQTGPDDGRYLWAGVAMPAGTYRLYLVTPPGTHASAELRVEGLSGATTIVPDVPATLHQRVREDRPSKVSPATRLVGGWEAPATGSVGFHVLRFEAAGRASTEVCSYPRGDYYYSFVPDGSGPLAYEPGCLDGLHTMASRGPRIAGDPRPPWPVDIYYSSTWIEQWFAPDDHQYHTLGGNITSRHQPRVTMTSSWIDFADD